MHIIYSVNHMLTVIMGSVFLKDHIGSTEIPASIKLPIISCKLCML